MLFWVWVAIAGLVLYWLGLQLNPPMDVGNPIIPEPNNLLRDSDE